MELLFLASWGLAALKLDVSLALVLIFGGGVFAKL